MPKVRRKKIKRIKKIKLKILQLHTPPIQDNKHSIKYYNTIRVSKSVSNNIYLRLQKITNSRNVSLSRTTLDGTISSEDVSLLIFGTFFNAIITQTNLGNVPRYTMGKTNDHMITQYSKKKPWYLFYPIYLK